MKTINDTDIHKGHRSRMRQKLLLHGSEIFDTYELLEMLLYTTIPAKDTNPIAKRLLAAFGSLEGVFTAGEDELLAIDGIGEKTARMLCSVATLSDTLKVKVELSEMKFDDYDKVGEYFVEYFDGAGDYGIAAMLLDNSMNLIGVHTVYDGADYQSAGVKSSAFVELALTRGASVVIIAHNHPYGPLYPTEGDVKTNAIVAADLSDVGVLLVDHYVVTGERYLGFMASTKKRIAQQRELSKFYRTKNESVGRASDAL